MIKKAMILAAGFGKRINPVTKNSPKPLLEIGGVTLLSNTLKFLQDLGIESVVINVHYLKSKIIEYIKNNKFNLKIKIVEEDKILDTGGGILNTINFFANDPFIVINPDTLWNKKYLKIIESMEDNFLKNNKNKCSLLVVNKEKSFDKTFKGDFELKNNFISRKDKNNLRFIYTGFQIINPIIFNNINEKIFSMNKIWNKLIVNETLNGTESNIDFFHVSNLDIYRKLKNLNFK